MKRETWGGTRFGIIAGACLAIEGMGGCAHTPPPEPIVKTVEVKTPVPVQCHATVTLQSYADAGAEFMTDIRDQVVALLKGRSQRKADAERMKGAIEGCGGTVK